MSRSLARCAGVIAVGCALLVASAAFARGGGKVITYRVDLRTGSVQTVAQPLTLPPERAWPLPPADRRRVTSDERTVLVYEGEPPDAKLVWQTALPGSGPGGTAWQILQGSTVAVAWFEEVAGQRGQYRQIARALDMASGKLLWERVDVMYDRPEAAAAGADHLVVTLDKEVLLLETRTGRELRRLPKVEQWFAVATPAPGRVWIEAGNLVECVDARTLTPIWRAAKQGAMQALLPVAGTGDWLVKTTSHTYRWRGSDGRAVWAAASASATRPVLAGDRIYEGALLEEERHQRARIALVARDLATGKVARTYELGRHDQFFDQSTVVALEARDGRVDVATRFIILD